MTTNTLAERFDKAMLDVYQRAHDEAGYHATRFFQMLTDMRGVETARTLLHADRVSDGYTALWERGRLDLTIEAVILNPQWDPLFSDHERRVARQRLREYGYDIAAQDGPDRGDPDEP